MATYVKLPNDPMYILGMSPIPLKLSIINREEKEKISFHSMYNFPDTQTYSIDEAIESIGFGKFQVKVAMYSGMAWVADSMEVMVLSILGPVLECEWGLNSTQKAFVSTTVFIGYLIGSPICGFLGDKHGRKTSLMMSAMWALFYGVLSAFAPNYTWLIMLRGLLGVGVSGVPQAVTYCSEFLPLKYRGKCILILMIFWSIGTLLEVLLAMLILTTGGWRIWLLASAFPLLIFLLLCNFFPESPRYLAAKGNISEAENVLKMIAKQNGTKLPLGHLRPDPYIEAGSICDLFDEERMRTTVLLIIAWVCTGFAYYGIVLLSTEIINNEVGCLGEGIPIAECAEGCKKLTNNDYLQLMWTSFAELPGLGVTWLTIDRFGRKKSLYFEFFAFSITCYSLMICTGKSGLITLLFLARGIIAAAFQVLYVYTPEVYPTTTRGLALGITSASARIGCIITPFIAEVMIEWSLYSTVMVYGTSGLIAGIASFLLKIETKDRKLQSFSH